MTARFSVSPKTRNRDFTHKAKDLKLEAKTKAKDLNLKAKAKDLSLKAKAKDFKMCPRGSSRTTPVLEDNKSV